MEFCLFLWLQPSLACEYCPDWENAARGGVSTMFWQLSHMCDEQHVTEHKGMTIA